MDALMTCDAPAVGISILMMDPNRSNRVQYENATDACAAYIKHEIEGIRSGK
jgi:hypothetical protein